MDSPELPPELWISFAAEIDLMATENLINAISSAQGNGAKRIHLLISSGGGFSNVGMHLYQILRALSIEIYTYNVAGISSIAIAPYLAGTKRFATPNSFFMFHPTFFQQQMGQTIDLPWIAQKTAELQFEHLRLSRAIADASGMNISQAEDLIGSHAVKDANFALEHGIAHEIRELEVPIGVPILSVGLRGP